jgi:hypothetical protein
MEHVGMDLGKKESQIAILTEAGELIEKRMRTERERLVAYFKDRPKAKILDRGLDDQRVGGEAVGGAGPRGGGG